MKTITTSEMAKYKREKPKIKQVTDLKGHKHDLKVAGRFEAIIFYCDKCNSYYKATKGEVV
jgi:hypothetical protein